MTNPLEQKIAALNRVLAEKPCPWCHGKGHVDGDQGQTTYESPCHVCQGLGLANPWASEECNHQGRTVFGVRLFYKQEYCATCNGSGRVPKAVGLEELFEHTSLTIVAKARAGEEKLYRAHAANRAYGFGETPLLAALGAVVKAQMP